METIEEEIKEKKSGWTRVLLIINLIIWTIIVFMAIVFNGVVNAATVNMTNWAWKDQSDNWNFVNTGDTTSMLSPKQLSFNFNGAQGNNNGTVYFEADVTGSISTSDITTQWWTNPNPSTTGTVSKNCTVTTVNTLTKHVRCQLNFTITNESDNLNIILNFANGRPFSNATATGSTVATPTNNATTSDIVNQTIQITNQIIQSVQESMQNVESTSGDIIYAMSQAITEATQQIIGKDIYCGEEKYIIKWEDVTQGKYIDVNGNEQWVSGSGLSDYLLLNSGEVIIIQSTNAMVNASYCFYDENKAVLSCEKYERRTNIVTTAPTNTKYFRTSIWQTQTITITGNVCQDRIEWIMENQNSNTDRIIDRLYQDHQEQLEQLGAVYTAIQPDDTNWRDYVQAEEDLLDYSNVDFNSIQIDLDSDTNNWVWTTLSSILNTNSLVFGMVISILSIGIFKLILNR